MLVPFAIGWETEPGILSEWHFPAVVHPLVERRRRLRLPVAAEPRTIGLPAHRVVSAVTYPVFYSLGVCTGGNAPTKWYCLPSSTS